MVKHALIIGGTSIVGYQLASLLLLEGGWKVTGLARHRQRYAQVIEDYRIIECDMLAPDFDLRKVLGDSVKDVTHVFFMTWIPRPTEEEQVKVNRQLFRTIVDTVADASNNLEHLYLQTGSKYYAMHLGPKGGMVTPCKEDDERKGPNFYYALEDLVVEIANKRNLTWSVARPPCIIGFTLNTAMNLGVSFAVYAAVLKELGKPLVFPYGDKAFHCYRELASSKLVARFIFWLVDRNNPQNKNQAFNVTNGDLYRMEQLWRAIADYFGMEVQVTHDTNFNLKNFMNEHKEVWDRIVAKNGLEKHDLNSLGTWDFMEQMCKRDWDEGMLINKSLKYGWVERLDTLDVLSTFFDELSLRQIIPVQAAQQLPRKQPAAIKKKQKQKKKEKGVAGPPKGQIPVATKSEPTRG
jgi:nucleoside-diphosphate-sugar epimerase